MIKYINFNTSAEFELWQLTKERKISQITPIPNMMEAKQKSSSDLDDQKLGAYSNDIDMNVTMGIFVLYFEE